MKLAAWFLIALLALCVACLFQSCLDVLGHAIRDTDNGPDPIFTDDAPSHNAPIIGPDSTSTDHILHEK